MLKIGQILIKKGFIDSINLNNYLAKQREVPGERIGKLLISEGIITEEQLFSALSEQYKIPLCQEKDFKLEQNLGQKVNYNLAVKYKLLPVKLKNKVLTLAMQEPLNLAIREEIKSSTGYRLKIKLISEKLYNKIKKEIYGDQYQKDQKVLIGEVEDLLKEEKIKKNNLNAIVDDAPVVKLVNLIIEQAIELDASDVHIEPQPDKIRVRYRVDGILIEKLSFPKGIAPAIISRIKIIAGMDITERRQPQDGRLEKNINGQLCDLRVAVIPTIYGEKAVMRILPKKGQLLNLEKIGFTSVNLNNFKKILNHSSGIILLTGPTGSGKTTTLFSALDRLNDPATNITTIEDPVEYKLKGITQIETEEKTGINFLTSLRAILRQDPDIIMLGEIRDEETAKIAIRAAITGHLVFSTLHTINAVSSITRLLEMNIPPYLVASSLSGVVAQRLVRKICPECRKSYYPVRTGIRKLDNLISEGIELKKGRGCSVCADQGYKGRVPIHEVLMLDDHLRELIMQGQSEAAMEAYAISKGMITLKEDGLDKVVSGITTLEEVLRVTG